MFELFITVIVVKGLSLLIEAIDNNEKANTAMQEGETND